MECSCEETDSVQAVRSDDALNALLAVFIVLLIILIAVGVFAGVTFFVCYRKMKSIPIDKLQVDQVSNGDGGHFSMASDIPKRPYSYDTPASPVSTIQRSKKGSISRYVCRIPFTLCILQKAFHGFGNFVSNFSIKRNW